MVSSNSKLQAMETTPTTPSPVSWRSVFELVQSEVQERRNAEERIMHALEDVKCDMRESSVALTKYIDKHAHEHELLEDKGTWGFRESAAEQKGRENALNDISLKLDQNFRWLVGLAVTLVGTGVTLLFHLFGGKL